MPQQGTQILAFVLFVLAAVDAVQLQYTMLKCCDEGARHAGNEGTCETINTSSLPDIGSEADEADEEDMKDCLIMMRSCCATELQRGVCVRGMETRSYDGSCDRVAGDGCASVEKTCCECCELGMRAYKESAPCDGTNLGTECDFAFNECCRRAGNANDVDQCALATSMSHRLCSVKCVNLIGSYVCECPDGLVLSTADNMTCVREDEVDPCDSSNCEQLCMTGEGSFTCACNEGHTLQPDGYSCRVDDHSTSLACMWANCESNCRPVGTDSYECYCDRGFELAGDRESCTDTNECERSADTCPSDRACVNTHGSYRCDPVQSCSTGRKFIAATSRCEDIDECQEESSCPLHNECFNYDGGFYCWSTNCIEGQRFNSLTRQCLDVDECARGLHDCGDGFRCDNSPGSFRCTRILPCGTGYTVSSVTQSCEDINECFQNTDDCPPTFYCQNTIGSYKCKPCREGFKADTTEGCTIDVNECEDQADACPPDQTCVNAYGSFHCNPGCPQGSTYNDFYGECRDVNECALGLHDCRSNQVCHNLEGSFRCSCLTGRTFNEQTHECDDIDECELGTHNCLPHEQCFNFEGSFRCQQRCQRNYRYNATVGCVDINECEKTVYPCMGNFQCINMPGAFRCQQCPRGQIANRVSRRCEDVDECKYRGLRCMGGCRNTIGSFVCTCPSGYERVDTYNCRDINECRRNIHNCSSQSACFDTRGGFKCKNIQCPQHYRREVTRTEEVRCIKDRMCPNHDLECANNNVRIISHSQLPLPDMSDRAVEEPFQLSTLQVRGLTREKANRLEFLLTQGNELGLFNTVKNIEFLDNSGTFSAVGTLYLMRPVTGPYQTDLRIEMTLFNQNREIISITAVILSVDISSNPF